MLSLKVSVVPPTQPSMRWSGWVRRWGRNCTASSSRPGSRRDRRPLYTPRVIDDSWSSAHTFRTPSPRSGVVGTSTTWTPQGTCICDGLGSSLTCAAAVGLPRRNRPRSAGHYELSSPVGCESYLRCCPIPALSLPLIETLLITVVRLWERCNGSSRSWNGPDMSTQARMAGGCTAFATCSVDGSRLTHWIYGRG